MTLFQFTLISAGSILLPFAVTLFRLSRLKKRYLPFLLLIWFGILNESTSYLRIQFGQTTAVNGNIYVLLNLILLIWFFYQKRLNLPTYIFISFLLIGIFVWVIDNLFLHSLHSNNSLFRMIASLLIVYLGIDKISQIVFFWENKEDRISDLLICSSLVSYFTYKAFVESFHVFTLKMGYDFFHGLWFLLAIVNVITNCIFTIAILCIKPKQHYTSHI